VKVQKNGVLHHAQPGVEPATNSMAPQEANQLSYENYLPRSHAQTYLIRVKRKTTTYLITPWLPQSCPKRLLKWVWREYIDGGNYQSLTDIDLNQIASRVIQNLPPLNHC